MSYPRTRFWGLPFADAEAGAPTFILGAPFEGAVSFRVGCREGPDAIRESSYNMETRVWGRGLDMAGAAEDLGDAPGERDACYRRIAEVFGSDGRPGVLLGGDHSVSVPAVRALSERHGNLRVLVLDAHSDFRQAYEDDPMSHACASRRFSEIVGARRLAVIGVRSTADEERDDAFGGVCWVPADEVRSDGIGPALFRALEAIGPGPVYLSVDIDAVDPAYAPGVGTPEPFGLTPWEIRTVVRTLCGRLVGMDVVEVCPPCDTGATAALAAALVREGIASLLNRP